ncbi:MAG TPA: DNA recombination protein RmuC [Chiayiivirga sp.]|nr:DNA recombination protein RmuC [Chiayiivirga sp.]
MNTMHISLALGALGIVSMLAWLAALAWRRRSVDHAVASAQEQARLAHRTELAILERDQLAALARAEDLKQRLGTAEGELGVLRERGDRLSDERAVLAAQAERSQQFEQRVLQLQAELRVALEAQARDSSRASELEARLQEQQGAHQRHLVEFDERLKAELAQLAQGLLDEKIRRFDESSGKQMDGLLTPLREQLKTFAESVQRTNVEIVSLKELNQRITSEAQNLTRALKGDTQVQGAWGEQVLERLLEMSGLQCGRGYDLQVVVKAEDGSRPRPDVIVRLPDAKDLIIDSKVSLLDWDRALAAVDEAARETAMKAHVGALKRHIDGLGKRDYSAVDGLRTLDFVLMFVPVEAAFIEAVRRDEALYGFALERNIALVSPSTLLATLRTVAHLWRMEDRNRNAEEIARQAGALHDSFVKLESDLTQMGALLQKTSETQQSIVRRISSGRGNLMNRVDGLRRLGAKASKQLPQDRFDEAVDVDGEVSPDLD